MRTLIPTIHVDPTPDGEWMATVLWVDDAGTMTGQLTTGPGPDATVFVDGLSDLIRDLDWPWLWWPKQDRHPQVLVSERVPDVVSALEAWARPRGWTVSVFRGVE